jgi:hypothetical protein
MSDYNEQQVQKIIAFFDQQGQDYWKTVDEVARGTRIDARAVISIFSSTGEFVRSSYRTKAGEPVFTTRKLFRNKAPFMDKMIGIFKNRID